MRAVVLLTHCYVPLIGSLSSQSVTFSHLNHAWQILEEVRVLCASAGFSLPLDTAGLTRQTSKLHPEGPHPFKGICCICCIVQPLVLTCITATYAKPRVPISAKVSCLPAPKGLLSSWKYAQFPAAFLPQGLFSQPTWAEGDQELWHATWGMAAPTSGFKEEQDETCATRCDGSSVQVCPLTCTLRTQRGQVEDVCAA